jgi:hypothetical protein
MALDAQRRVDVLNVSLAACMLYRFAAPTETFWNDIEAQVLESLRQAKRAPRITDLVCSTEEAIFLHSKQRHYAQLASRLFGEQVCAVSLLPLQFHVSSAQAFSLKGARGDPA